MRISICCRVSKDDGRQHAINQLDDLRAWAERLGGEVVAEYQDRRSGKNEDRERLQECLRDAHERRWDVLLIWSLDRLSRQGVEATIGLLRRLQASGVVVRSLKEDWLNTSDPHVAELLISIMSWLAKSERRRLIERTVAGIARAKRQGVHCGRPRLQIDNDQAARAMQKHGSLRKAAAELRMSVRSLRRR